MSKYGTGLPEHRVSGFYKVYKYITNKDCEYVIAEWNHRVQCWYLTGTTAIFHDDYFINISKERIKL